MTEGLFALGGVILGSVLTWINELYREKRRQAKKAHYLAIRLVPILEQFFDSCLDVVGDDGTVNGQPAGADGEYEVQVLAPTLLFPKDVDWKSIDQNLLQRIMLLPRDIYLAERTIRAEAEDPNAFPDGGDFIAVRRYEYAQVAIKCHELLKDLSSNFQISMREYSSWWNPCDYCKKYINQYEEIQEKKNRS